MKMTLLAISHIIPLFGTLGLGWILSYKGHTSAGVALAFIAMLCFMYNLWDILKGRDEYVSTVLKMRDEIQGASKPEDPPPNVQEIIKNATLKREIEKKVNFDNMFRPDPDV